MSTDPFVSPGGVRRTVAALVLFTTAVGHTQGLPGDVPPSNATRSTTGLASMVVSPGTGSVRPDSTSVVTVRYEMWSNGRLVDSSRARGGTPSTWRLDRVMPGLREGIQLMVAGEKRRLWIPPVLGYLGLGDRPEGVLVFDVELIAVGEREAPPKDEFAAPPRGAARTARGVAYQVLRAGTGTEHPRPLGTVTVNYIGWTEHGTRFDDSFARDQPLKVAVDTLMPGLSDAVQQMVAGEKTRFWIPAELAYQPPGPPRSALVFDVELLAIQHAVDGPRGTVTVQTNSPDAPYTLVQPDGTPLAGKGSQTFASVVPGPYRIKPDRLKSYATGIVAAPGDMTLPPGGSLSITITYKPIVQ